MLLQLEEALEESGATHDSVVFSRVYFGDVQRNASLFLTTRLYRELARGAVSLIGQAPLACGPVALFCYHIVADGKSLRRKSAPAVSGSTRDGILLQGNYDTLWLAGFGNGQEYSARAQAAQAFRSAAAALATAGMDWAGSVLRTWIFIDDIDRHYAEMVESRLEYFSRHGLTGRKRYPASTGIGAHLPGGNARVGLELLAMKGLAEGQVQAMVAEANMPPAMSYGVSFERGLKIRFGDRIHYHISGTASISKDGEIMHPGDAESQTERALENVEALLASEGAHLSDLAYLLVYLRDPAALPQARRAVSRRLPENVPCLFLEGPVCRPGWLVEVEGVAIQSSTGPYPDFP